MEDNLEKVTIHIDSKNAEFLDDYEFYVDILDDIKNVIYIKTLKTEIYTTYNYKYISKYDGVSKEYFENGDYIYVTLNNFNRVSVVSREVIPQTKFDIVSETEPEWNGVGDSKLKTEWLDSTDNPIVLFNQQTTTATSRDSNNLPINFKIKDTRTNLLKYYDAVNIIKNTSLIGAADDLTTKPYYLFKNELTGTSCGPNDTNTLVVNPIEPELKRFNVSLWYVNEDGKHEKLKIRNQDKIYTADLGIFRVVMSFTIYYKRKKITRV
jgi:hypothetical protein